jgi:hypothetical protein
MISFFPFAEINLFQLVSKPRGSGRFSHNTKSFRSQRKVYLLRRRLGSISGLSFYVSKSGPQICTARKFARKRACEEVDAKSHRPQHE